MSQTGSRLDEPAEGAATVYVFDVAGGRVNSIELPDGFEPVHATDETLALFGFGVRPKDPSGLKDWNARYEGFRAHPTSEPPAMCQAEGGGYAVHDRNDPYWGGMEFDAPAFSSSSVHGKITQPTSQGCGVGHSSSHGYWVGIGGVNPTTVNGYSAVRLMQAGTNADGAVSSDPDMFFEALITGVGDTGPVQQAGKVVHPGDVVSTDVYFKNGNTLVFNVSDITTGVSFITSTTTGFFGRPSVEFWDGASTEWIEERKQNGDELRDQTPDVTPWSEMKQNGLSPGPPSSWYTVANHTYWYGTLLSEPENYDYGPGTFGEHWHHC